MFRWSGRQKRAQMSTWTHALEDGALQRAWETQLMGVICSRKHYQEQHALGSSAASFCNFLFLINNLRNGFHMMNIYMFGIEVADNSYKFSFFLNKYIYIYIYLLYYYYFYYYKLIQTLKTFFHFFFETCSLENLKFI
jgi:hypothetical protein